MIVDRRALRYQHLGVGWHSRGARVPGTTSGMNDHLNPTGIPLEQAGKRLLRLFDCCPERKLRRYPRIGSTNVVFRSQVVDQ